MTAFQGNFYPRVGNTLIENIISSQSATRASNTFIEQMKAYQGNLRSQQATLSMKLRHIKAMY